jgi:spore germination cell wall hydrolase CwlJ-like protein
VLQDPNRTDFKIGVCLWACLLGIALALSFTQPTPVNVGSPLSVLDVAPNVFPLNAVPHFNRADFQIPRPHDNPQFYCIALATFGEARGESALGQAAVATTIINRSGDPRYPGDPCKIIFQPNQYQGAEKWRYKQPWRSEPAAWGATLQIVNATINNQYVIQLGACATATNFYNPKKAHPMWAHHESLLCTIDNHRFYRT